MKKFIDKESGKIVTVLNNDEAKKILEMYIEYCQGKREVKKGRLNLVKYLGDFIKYSNGKDMAKFYDTLLKLKENLELSKTEQKAYDALLSFFEIYNKIEKGDFEVSSVTSFITNTMSKKQTIDEKILGNQELNFEEKIVNIFFNEDFDLSILAKNACDKWDEILKEKINSSNGEIEVSLKEEIAYQDLLALSNKENVIVSLKENKENNFIENEEKVEEKTEEINVNVEGEDEIAVEAEGENEINSGKKEEVEEENKTEKEQENFVGPIIVNSFNDEKEDKKESSDSEEIIGANTISEKTSDVSLRDAANLFNQAIDEVKENNNQDGNSNNDSNNDDTQSSSSSYGTLRDM